MKRVNPFSQIHSVKSKFQKNLDNKSNLGRQGKLGPRSDSYVGQTEY